MTTVRVNMPQMAVVGLSENWLLRHCGDGHWSRLCGSLGVLSSRLVSEQGERLYASFLAIRMRASQPLAAYRENEELREEARLERFGNAVFASRTSLVGQGSELSVEMLTKFVARRRAGANDLHPAVLQHGTESTARELDGPPELASLYQRVKRGLGAHEMLGVEIPAVTGPTAERAWGQLSRTRTYEPNPYVDYNGAGLLYFASYPTIADHLERLYVADHDLFDPGRDWALASSTVARDVFYFGNLDLGEPLFGTVNAAFPRDVDGQGRCAFLHTSLWREKDRQLLAEVFSVKRLEQG